MKKLKSVLFCLLAAVLVLSLCACGPQEAAEPSAELPTEPSTMSAPPTTETPTEPPTTEPQITEPENTGEWLPDGPVEPEVITAYSGTAIWHAAQDALGLPHTWPENLGQGKPYPTK